MILTCPDVFDGKIKKDDRSNVTGCQWGDCHASRDHQPSAVVRCTSTETAVPSRESLSRVGWAERACGSPRQGNVTPPGAVLQEHTGRLHFRRGGTTIVRCGAYQVKEARRPRIGSAGERANRAARQISGVPLQSKWDRLSFKFLDLLPQSSYRVWKR